MELFILSILAVWRITHLLGKEDGPFDIVFLLRKKAGAGFFGNLLDCFYCLSIWIALPLGIWLGQTWIEKILMWLHQGIPLAPRWVVVMFPQEEHRTQHR